MTYHVSAEISVDDARVIKSTKCFTLRSRIVTVKDFCFVDKIYQTTKCLLFSGFILLGNWFVEVIII